MNETEPVCDFDDCDQPVKYVDGFWHLCMDHFERELERQYERIYGG